MSSYTASSVRADGGSTATWTYPYNSAAPVHMHAAHSKHGFSPNPPETGRLVLQGNRAGAETRPVHTPSARVATSVTPSSFSTSFGAAAEALSPPSLRQVTGAKRTSDVLEHEMDESMDRKPAMSYTMPSNSAGAMDAAARHYRMGGRRSHEHQRTGSHSTPPPLSLPMPASPASSTTEDSEVKDHTHGKEGPTTHKCESCSKVYRHPSCLVKHRWEHTMYWKEASKFLMSKHQQVQLLEAAAILVGMDSHAQSLPEEKALWPAAVSPPASGLLGCELVNFEKLKASKARNAASLYPDQSPRVAYGTSAPAMGNTHMRNMRQSPMLKAEAPLRSVRATSRHQDDMVEDADDAAEIDHASRQDTYGLHSGGDVMADMDMDG